MNWLEAIADGFKACGAKKVVLLDPRVPTFLQEGDLPAVALNILGGSVYMGVPGNPLAIYTVPGEEGWPLDSELVWWRLEEISVTVAVYGLPGTTMSWALAGKLLSWLQGEGREELRAARAHVTRLTSPKKAVEILEGLESAAVDVTTFEMTVAVYTQTAQRVPTVEEVGLRRLEDETAGGRAFTVRTNGEVR